MPETLNIETVREKLQVLTRYDEESRGYDGTGIGTDKNGEYVRLEDVLEIFGLEERYHFTGCGQFTTSIEKKN